MWLNTDVASPPAFPLPLSSYGPEEGHWLFSVLFDRASKDPFNLVATVIFFLAVAHTLLCPFIKRFARSHQEFHDKELEIRQGWGEELKSRDRLSPAAAFLNLLGEVEVVFALWTVPLMAFAVLIKKAGPALDYLNQANYTQPMFIVVTMIIASSRPIVQTVSRLMTLLSGDSPVRWWWVLLTAGPIMGSFITEPAAMTICALLLGREFYRLEPSPRFAYATLALLFTNISVGGSLTHFAAAPILMVADQWNWGTPYVFAAFGIKAIGGITAANALYFFLFRSEFKRMTQTRLKLPPDISAKQEIVPVWVVVVHVLFLVWTVLVNHEAPLFIGGFLFYVGFISTSMIYQDELNIRGPLLVGLFLAGLVIHGGLQGWWIEPILSHLGYPILLLVSSAFLSSFNDNAAVTYLAVSVPALTESIKYALVAGAICGGGLTVIANAPNPAGQTLLEKYFPEGIEPIPLVMAAALPTIIMIILFGFTILFG